MHFVCPMCIVVHIRGGTFGGPDDDVAKLVDGGAVFGASER